MDSGARCGRGGPRVPEALGRPGAACEAAAGVVRGGDKDLLMVRRAETEEKGLKLFLPAEVSAAPTSDLSGFSVPLVVAGVVVLWVMVWSGIWVGGLLKRSYELNKRLSGQTLELACSTQRVITRKVLVPRQDEP